MAAAGSAPLAALALLLALAGLAKLHRPGPAVRALRSADLPGPPGLIRAGAAAELALGVWVLAAGAGAAAWCLAGVYLGFAVLSARLLGRAKSCGCFGAQDGPLTRGHVALCLVCATLAAGAAAAGAPAPLGWIGGLSAEAAGTLALASVAGAGALVLCFTELPSAWRAWSPGGER